MKIEITDKEFTSILCCLWEGHDFMLYDKLKDKYISNERTVYDMIKLKMINEEK